MSGAADQPQAVRAWRPGSRGPEAGSLAAARHGLAAGSRLLNRLEQPVVTEDDVYGVGWYKISPDGVGNELSPGFHGQRDRSCPPRFANEVDREVSDGKSVGSAVDLFSLGTVRDQRPSRHPSILGDCWIGEKDPLAVEAALQLCQLEESAPWRPGDLAASPAPNPV